MSEQDHVAPDAVPDAQSTSSAAIIGVLLVAAGLALLLDRTGVLPAPWRVSIWPVLLIGYGIARLTEPRRRGREGLFFVLAGAWWLAGTAGWLSMTLTWPLLIVAAGASLVLQAFTAPHADEWSSSRGFGRRRRVGGWILPIIVVGAVLTSQADMRMLGGADRSSDGDLRAVAIMGRRTIDVTATALRGGEVMTVMGSNWVDLREALPAPGSTITLNVFGLMGTSIITVPAGWTVDVQTVPVMGNVEDRRRADDWDTPRSNDAADPSGTPTRLVLRGTVIMGRLVVRS